MNDRLYTCFYFENFFGSTAFSVKKGDDGGLVADWSLLWSDGPIWGYSVAETGAFVLEALKKPDEWVGMSQFYFPAQSIDSTRFFSYDSRQRLTCDDGDLHTSTIYRHPL